MNTVSARSMLSLGTLCLLTLVLVFVAAPAVSTAGLLDFKALGSGAGRIGCSEPALPCVVSAEGTLQGTQVGNATFSVVFRSNGVPAFSNGDTGFCVPMAGHGTFTAKDGAEVWVRQTGILCEKGGAGTPYIFNGTYLLVGGTGRFDGASGSGSFTGSDTRTGSVLLNLHGSINY